MYVDLVFLLTYVAHFLLMTLTCHIMGIKKSRVWCHVISFLLSLINLMPVLMSFSHYRFIQLLLSLICLSWFFFTPSKAKMRQRFVAMTIVTCFFAGTLFLITSHITVSLPLMLLVFIISYHLYLRLYQQGVCRHIQTEHLYDIAVTMNQQTIQLKAFFDTGHQLIDPITHASVLFIDPIIFNQFNLQLEHTDEDKKRQLFYQDINAHVQAMTCIKPDSVTVMDHGEVKEVSHVLLGLRQQNFREEEGFQALFGPQLLTLLKS